MTDTDPDETEGRKLYRQRADSLVHAEQSIGSRRVDLFSEAIERGAEISDCGQYRYALWRRWDKSKPRLIFIMLNPSTADAEQDDATIRVCIGRARRMDMGGIRVLNLFAYRATNPDELKQVDDPIGPENDRAIERYLGMRSFSPERDEPEPMIAAWGDGGLQRGHNRERWREVVSLICGEMGDPLYCLGLTKAGQPKHPLRIGYDVPIALWMDRQRYYNAC